MLISILRENQAWCGAGCFLRYPGCALDRSNLAEVYFLQSFIIKICMIDVCALDLFIVAALSLISHVARLGKTGQGNRHGETHNSS